MKLWDYIKGDRRGKEAHRLEKEAMTDPFLAHALCGLDKVKRDHVERIEQLQKEVQKRGRRRPNYLRAAGIAASILLVFGIGTYILVDKAEVSDDTKLAVEYELAPDSMLPAASTQPIVPEVSKPLVQQQQEEINDEMPLARATVPELEVQEEISMAPTEDTTSLDEIVVTGYQTRKKQALTSAVQDISASKIVSASKIKGKVTDAKGDPLIGANVSIPGTNEGTLTDTNGYFELQVADGKRVQVAYIGYESLNVPVDTGEVMHIAMNESQSTLDEVVVSGYGTSKKSVMGEPKPVDGKRKYNKYIKENLRRPGDDDREIKGKVLLSFNVDLQGRPIDIRVVKSLSSFADQEAVRLLSEGPNWTQGDKPGKLEVKF